MELFTNAPSASLFSLLLSASLSTAQAAFIPTPEITGSVTNQTLEVHSTYNDDAAISSIFSIQVATTDVGRLAPLYLVAQANDEWYMRNDQGQWLLWDQQESHLLPTDTRILNATESLDALSGEQIPVGEYTLRAGYGNESGDIVYNLNPVAFTIFDDQSSRLHRVGSSAMLESFLKDGLQQDLTNNSYYLGFDQIQFEGDTAAVTGADQLPTEVSTTTLQESGVDEADRIKVNGEYVYVVGDVAQANQSVSQGMSLDFWPGPSSTQTVLRSYSVTEVPAATTLLNTLELDTLGGNHNLYMATERQNQLPDLIVTVGTEGFDTSYWLDTWHWREGKTKLQFINADNPSDLQRVTSLEFDGSLVASRRVGETLYLVTRFSPSIPNIISYPTLQEDIDRNNTLLETTSLADLLPKVRIDLGSAEVAVDATDCYLSPVAKNQWADPSVVTITAIPLSTPEQFQSSCIVGQTDALYMSPQSLYLATTRHEYSGGGGIAFDSILYQQGHTTLIHKFAIDASTLSYRGSGEVPGHLGWEQNKKSFRFGEQEDRLHVASSIGETWSGDSSTRLAVLQEDVSNESLKEVGHLDNLGKPGEKLYASRFFGDQGYLVTFRVTDPLYVLDLSDPTQPLRIPAKMNTYSGRT